MTRGDVKEKLDALLEVLPDDKAELLLDFAAFLKQQVQAEVQQPPAIESEAGLDIWDQEIIAAEDYWFGLPEETRRAYVGKTAAVIASRILDSDSDREALETRIETQYPDRPVLYIEGEAKYLEPLVVITPHFL